MSEGADVVFNDVTCKIARRKAPDGPTTTKIIVDNISGFFPKGQVTAIMGASGAGKTTLLQTISGRLTDSKVEFEGNIYINSQNITSARSRRKIFAYVHQEDCIDPWMTVEEAIRFPLLVAGDHAIADIKNKADHIMELLELKDLKDSLVGSSSGSSGKRGISGGERKRVAIAMELMRDPWVLFLDEPTTGLDTFLAWRVVGILYKLSRVAGYTIVLNIHQPPSCVFPYFDNLLLLSPDGINGAGIVYQGNARHSIQYFAQLGYQCPRLENPSDYYFMNILNPRTKSAEYCSDKDLDIRQLMNIWEHSQEHEELLDTMNTLIQSQNQDIPVNHSRPDPSSRKQPIIFRQTWIYYVLLMRQFKSYWRSRTDLLIFVFCYPIFVGLLLGLTYLNLSQYSGMTQLDLRAAAIFFIVNTQFVAGIEHWVCTFVDDQSIFYREYDAKYYRLLPFTISKLTFELALATATTSLLVLICYYMIGLAPPFSSALFLIMTGIIAYTGGCGFGSFLIAVLTRDAALSTLFFKSAGEPLTAVGGFFVVKLPAFMVWLKFVSPVYYAFSAALQNQLASLACKDNGDGECLSLKNEDLYALLEFDAVLSPGVSVSLGCAVALTFLMSGMIIFKVRRVH